MTLPGPLAKQSWYRVGNLLSGRDSYQDALFSKEVTE